MNKNSPRKYFHESRKETEKISNYLGKSTANRQELIIIQFKILKVCSNKLIRNGEHRKSN